MENYKPNRRPTWLIVLVIGIVVIVLTAVGVYNRYRRLDDAIISKLDVKSWPIDVRTVQRTQAIDHFMATGTLRAEKEAVISAEVAARVVRVNKDLGEQVKKGETIVLLDASAYSQQQSQAKAQFEGAKSTFSHAKKDFQRAKELHAKGLISDTEYEQLELARKNANANFKASLAQYKLASRNLREARIRAPFNGFISKRNVEVGTLVSPGQPVVTVVSKNRLKMTLGLSENRIARIVQDAQVQVEVPALDRRRFTGTVHRVGVASDSTTGSFPVEVLVEVTDTNLLPGMSARAYIVLQSFQDVLVVPNETVLNKDDGQVVFVVEDGKAVEKAVGDLRSIGTQIIVGTGLEAGDALVVVGQTNLRDGAQVTIINQDGQRIESTPATQTETGDET